MANSSLYPLHHLSDVGVDVLDCEHKTPKPATSGYPYIAIPNIRDGFLTLNEVRLISEKDLKEWTRRTKPQAGDIILTRRARVGDTAVIPDGLECAIGQNLVILRSKGTHVLQHFLRWLLRSPYYWDQVAKYQNEGAVFSSLNVRDIGKFELPIPPLPIQHRIAEILGRLDDKIEVNRRINRTLEQMAQALYKDWFVDFGPFQAGEFVESELGPIPKGWEVKPVSSIVELLSGGTPSTKVPEYWKGEIPWVAASDVVSASPFVMSTDRTITQLGVANSSTQLLPAFTTIITARGTVGANALLSRPMAMNQTNYGIRGRGILGNFTTYLLVSHAIDNLKQHAYGTVFDTITRATFNSVFVPVPIDNVLRQFELVIAPLFSGVLNNEKQNLKLAEIRDYLLPKLLSGEIAVEAAEEWFDVAELPASAMTTA